MKRINPIYVLIVLNIVLVLFRDVLLPEETSAALAATIETSLARLGIVGYAGIVAAYALCGFFFVPLLIPLNILGGALYGVAAGTAIALVGITLSCIASTVSVRHVFTGMQRSIGNRPTIQRLIAHADTHRNLSIVMVRFAFIVPYLVQNIALAATGSSVTRIALVTTLSALPGAAIYSALGAGLVQAASARELFYYLTVVAVMILFLMVGMAYMKRRSRAGESS